MRFRSHTKESCEHILKVMGLIATESPYPVSVKDIVRQWGKPLVSISDVTKIHLAPNRQHVEYYLRDLVRTGKVVRLVNNNRVTYERTMTP